MHAAGPCPSFLPLIMVVAASAEQEVSETFVNKLANVFTKFASANFDKISESVNHTKRASQQTTEQLLPAHKRVILQPRKVLPQPSVHEPLLAADATPSKPFSNVPTAAAAAAAQQAGFVQTRRLSSPLATSDHTPPPFTGDLQLWTTADSVTPPLPQQQRLATSNVSSLSLLDLMLRQQHEKLRGPGSELPTSVPTSTNQQQSIDAVNVFQQQPMTVPPPSIHVAAAAEREVAQNVDDTSFINNNSLLRARSGLPVPVEPSSSTQQQQQQPNQLIPTSNNNDNRIISAVAPNSLTPDEFHQLQQNALVPPPVQQPSNGRYRTPLVPSVAVPPPPPAVVPTTVPKYEHRAMLNWTFTCTGRQSGYHANIEDRCQSFFFCDVLGNKVFTECPLGLQFNLRTQVCDWPSRAGKCPVMPSSLKNDTSTASGRNSQQKKMTKQGGIYRFTPGEPPHQFGLDDYSRSSYASSSAGMISASFVLSCLTTVFVGFAMLVCPSASRLL